MRRAFAEPNHQAHPEPAAVVEPFGEHRNEIARDQRRESASERERTHRHHDEVREQAAGREQVKVIRDERQSNRGTPRVKWRSRATQLWRS